MKFTERWSRLMDMDANFQFVHLQPMAGVRYTLPAYDLAIIGIER